MSNYITEQELNAIKGLMHYLNDNMPPSAGIAVDANVIDSNGDTLGLVTFVGAADEGYVMRFPNA